MRDIQSSNIVTLSRSSSREQRNAGRREPTARSVAIPLPANRIAAISPESILARLLELTRVAFRIGRTGPKK